MYVDLKEFVQDFLGDFLFSSSFLAGCMVRETSRVEENEFVSSILFPIGIF